VKSALKRIHERRSRHWSIDELLNTVTRITSPLRGWCGYFNQGPVIPTYELIRKYGRAKSRRRWRAIGFLK
jgi:hypothetical protein